MAMPQRMMQAEEMESPQQAAAENMAADDAMLMSESEDLAAGAPAEGYLVEISVYNDGSYAVMKKDMMAQAPAAADMIEDGIGAEMGEEAMLGGERLGSLSDALKAAMQIIKDNPTGMSAEMQMDDGYGNV